MMRVLVCGGRDYDDADRVDEALDKLHAKHGIQAIINGGAPGTDTLAIDWASSRNVKCITIKAKWDKYGRMAGPLRNAAMIDALPDLVVAFKGGPGTRDMVRRAGRAGIRVQIEG